MPSRPAGSCLVLLGLLLLGHLGATVAGADNFIECAHIENAYTQYADIWGYTDPGTNNEYAIIGVLGGVSIWNITDPFNPYETGYIPAGFNNGWHDMKTYGHYIYAVTEGGGGIQIIDVLDPESPTLVRNAGAFSSHNIWIDVDTGIAYCVGLGGSGGGGASGFRSFDLTQDPENPTVITNKSSPYYHDIYVKNGKGYGAAIFNGGRMDVLRLTTPSNPTTMGIATYPNGASHATWTSDDEQYCFVADEKSSNATMHVIDVSDTSNMLEVGVFPTYPATSSHNVFVKNDTAYVSWYEEGVLVFDVTDPPNPVLIGSFDTGPDTSTPPFGTYAGCWGVYPFFPSGLIVSSDILRGLHVLYYADEIGTLSGTVTDFSSGDPIVGAEVRVPGFFDRTVTTDALGEYSVELPGGSHSVVVSAADHQPDSSVVAITDATKTVHDVALLSATGIGIGERAAPRVVLQPARPNPTRDATTLSFDLPARTPVSLVLFDASGRRVRTLASGSMRAGAHQIAWDGLDQQGRPVASGAFFARLNAGSEVKTTRIQLAR